VVLCVLIGREGGGGGGGGGQCADLTSFVLRVCVVFGTRGGSMLAEDAIKAAVSDYRGKSSSSA